MYINTYTYTCMCKSVRCAHLSQLTCMLCTGTLCIIRTFYHLALKDGGMPQKRGIAREKKGWKTSCKKITATKSLSGVE